MCGIAGSVQRDPIEKEQLRERGTRMRRALRHRGPDMEGLWVEPGGHAMLAFTRLAIQDLSPAANQPMCSEGGRFILVYNGEVYNCDELRERIGRPANTFRTHSDTEVLLACFEKLGIEATLRAVNGMFAIALWDGERHSLFLGRDRVGKKPLHYSRSGDRFTFASEIRGILAGDPRPRSVSREALEAYFHLTYIPAPLSIFSDIRKVRPGHLLEIKPDLSVEERPYWTVRELLEKRSRVAMPFREVVEAAEALLDDAVRRRLVSDVPVAVLLSGGMDSSLVSHSVVRRLQAPLQAFTIGLEDERLDETGAAQAIARRIGIPHQMLRLSRENALQEAERVTAALEEPFGDYSAMAMHAICSLSRQHATVLLTGDGGDEVFGGYTRYQWSTGWRSLVSRGYAHYRTGRVGLGKAEVGLELYRRLMTGGQDGGSASARFLEEVAGGLPRPLMASILDAMRYLDFQIYLPDDILVKSDRMSMACSAELRSPFLDCRLVEFSWKLAPDLLVCGATRKRVLRELFAQRIGADYLQAHKYGFGVPISDWLRGPMREQCETAVEELGRRHDLPVSGAEVRSLWAEVAKGGQTAAHRMWVVYALWRWTQQWERPADTGEWAAPAV